MPVAMGQAVPCSGGLLTPEFIVREAVRCGAVLLPKCRADMELLKATRVDATLLTPAPSRALLTAQNRIWAVSLLTVGFAVGVIVGWALSPRVSLP